MLLFIKIKLILIYFNFVYFIYVFIFKTRQEHACNLENNYIKFRYSLVWKMIFMYEKVYLRILND